MAKERKRQTVESSFAEPWIPANEGDELAGTYLGSDIVPAGKGGSRSFVSYKIKREEDGKLLGVSSAMLKTKFNQIPKGAFVWITYLGKVETQNGESRDYQVDVEQGTKMLDPFDGEEGDLNDQA